MVPETWTPSHKNPATPLTAAQNADHAITLALTQPLTFDENEHRSRQLPTKFGRNSVSRSVCEVRTDPELAVSVLAERSVSTLEHTRLTPRLLLVWINRNVSLPKILSCDHSYGQQELSYRKQIARKLRTQYVEGIYRVKYYNVALKSI